MQRVVSINLNDGVYQLEENGYTALFAYLDAIETRLKDDANRAQLIADIEHTIAGKCAACLGPTKTVITTAEIARIIAEMDPQAVPAEESARAAADAANAAAQGATSQGAAGAGAETTGTAGTAGTPGVGPETAPGEKTRAGWHYSRRLCQIREGGMIGGVCLGLATFFHIDVSLVRILFALFVLATGGWGILAYLALMFILPRATSVADAETPGPQTWPWDDGWPWDKHGWPWDRHGWPWDQPDWPLAGDRREQWRQQRQDWRRQRQEWRQQRQEWRAQRRADRVAYGPPPSLAGTLVIVFFVMVAFGWLTFWMRGSFFGGWPIFWGGPIFWGLPHWLNIVLFFVFLRFLLWPVWGRRWGWSGPSGYGVYQPYGPWMAMWHTIAWVGTIIFLIWLATQLVPGFYEFIRQFQSGWPNGRYNV